MTERTRWHTRTMAVTPGLTVLAVALLLVWWALQYSLVLVNWPLVLIAILVSKRYGLWLVRPWVLW
jgi:multisubunit Na+/H+ antiporter MnhG subunit